MKSFEQNFTPTPETNRTESCAKGLEVGKAIKWGQLREEVLSSKKTVNGRERNEDISYPPGISIAVIPEGADEQDFLKGLREAMENVFTDGYFMVDDNRRVFFNLEDYQKAAGFPDNVF